MPHAYRYEGPDGIGPYRAPNDAFERIVNKRGQNLQYGFDPETQPPPARDWVHPPPPVFEYMMYGNPFQGMGDLLFACPTPEALKRWFAGFETSLANHGFKVIEYEVEPRHYWPSDSGKQVVFQPSHARKLGEFKWPTTRNQKPPTKSTSRVPSSLTRQSSPVHSQARKHASRASQVLRLSRSKAGPSQLSR